MSLDGYVADADDDLGELLDWYSASDVPVSGANPDVSFMTRSGIVERTGAVIAGRRLFDITDGWGTAIPRACPSSSSRATVPDRPERWPRITFVLSVEDAVSRAREIGGERDGLIMSPNVTRQALELGLFGEVLASLAPVIIGAGIA